MPCISVQRPRIVISIYVIPSEYRLRDLISETVPVWRHGKERICRGALLVVFSPSPVHADVSVIFGLSGNRVAVAKKKLLVGVVLEVVVTANVDHSGSLRLRGGKAFPPVSKDLGTQLQP